TVARRISPRSAISRARSPSGSRLCSVPGMGPAPYPSRVADDPLPELRASDADREHTAELLRQAAGGGRLDVDELEERLSAVYATRTQRELDALVADVVVPEHRQRHGTPRVPVRHGEDGTRWLVAIMSGHDRKGRWRVGANLNVINVMG